MSALSELVKQELSTIGCRAQDLIDDDDAYSRVNAEVRDAWSLLQAGDLEGAAERARKVERDIIKIIYVQKFG